MNNIRAYLLLSLTALCLSATPACAQTGYYNADNQPPAAAADDDGADSGVSPSHTITVTSIEKCYTQLGRAETLDIERNFVKPYEECQRRLMLKLQAQQQLKAGQPQKPPAPAPAPGKDAAGGTDIMYAPPTVPIAAPAPTGGGLYYRVQKDPLPPGSASQ